MTNIDKAYAVIMAGGSGTRFWPLSRSTRPKQLLALGPDHRSLLRATAERVFGMVPAERTFVVTSVQLREQVEDELPELDPQQILAEPVGRNTAPCIGWAATHVKRLDEDAIIPNVETHICREKDALQYTLDNLKDLVVKPVGESGGYGVVVGPRSTAAEIEDVRKLIVANPANFISQPMVELSVCPTLVDTGIEPRHVDLRPFLITGKSTWVLPGGLTRVALKKGSLIVNSSQGGGTKDTWVLE